MRVVESWLGELVELPPPAELAARLVAAGVEVEHEAHAPSTGRTLELGITPNRSDLLSHVGLAREVAAFSNRRLLPAKWRLHEAGPRSETLARVTVAAPDDVRRYLGRIVRAVKVGPSPAWLSDRLVALGQRPVNNVVDVTNYVMFELGIPLHAFDLGHVAVEASLPTVRVVRAAGGESLTTLDGVERTLAAGDVCIADARGPLALAGILGGQASAVTAQTTDVWLEAAAFVPAAIRRTARHHGLRTEASLRFGRGVDASMVGRAADRAAQLLAELAGGEVASRPLDWQAKQEPSAEVLLPLAAVERVLGVQLTPEAIVALLEPLQIRVHRRTEAAIVFQVPPFRLDLSRDVDLLEEVARRHGLDQIPARLPSLASVLRGRAGRADAPATETAQAAAALVAPPCHVGERARRGLLAAGLTECVHFAFASEASEAPFAVAARPPLHLLNPLGEEQRRLRTTLLPGLLQALERNVRRGASGLAAFEIGTVFWQRQGAAARAAVRLAGPRPPRHLPAALAAEVAAHERGLPHEQRYLAVLLTGPRPGLVPWQPAVACDGHDLLGLWQALCAAYELAEPPVLRLGEVGPAPFNPHAAGTLWLPSEDGSLEAVGTLGQLEPSYVRSVGWSQPTFALEVDVLALEQAPARRLRAAAPPKYPGTRRDVAVIAPMAMPSEAVRGELLAAARARLPAGVAAEVHLFDVFAGPTLPPGHVSLGFALSFASSERTLADEEVAPVFAHVLVAVRERLGLEVRDGTGAA